MKKLWIIGFCAVLCACGNTQPQSKTKDKEVKAEQNLRFTNLSEGFGSNDGFYHLVMKDNEKGDTNYNIRYFDYTSKQEVFLCDKPECAHDNDQCTSYLPVVGGRTSLFVSGNHLYIMQNPSNSISMQADGNVSQSKRNPSILYQMDLDGGNKKQLCTLDEGFEFESTNIVLGKQELYVVANKSNLVATSENSSTEIKTDSFLFTINLTNGKMKKIQNMKDKFMIGAKHNTILLQKLHYAQDLDVLLQNKDYETYDQVARQATTSYQLFNIAENKLGKEFTTNENYPVFDGKHVYYLTQQNELCRLNIQSQALDVLAQLDSSFTYSLDSFIIDEYLTIEAWEKSDLNASYVTSYMYSLNDATLKEKTLTMKGIKEPLRILATTKDNYFMLYQKDGHMETTWANTQQFKVENSYYGMISKSDYWNNIDKFETVSIVRE